MARSDEELGSGECAGRMLDPEPGSKLLGYLILSPFLMIARDAPDEGGMTEWDAWPADR